MNRGEILTAGLEKAGRTDNTIKSLARTWLNLWLEATYEKFDWKWLEAISSGLSVSSNGTSLPTDYSRAISITVIDSNGNRLPDIEAVGPEEFEYQKRQTSSTGTPRYALIDTKLRKVYFWPIPSTAHTFDLRYYCKPDLVEAIQGSDSEDVVWGQNQEVLVQAVYVSALQYLDDARYQSELQILNNMLTETKINARDQRAGKSRMPLGRSFKQRFGRNSRRF